MVYSLTYTRPPRHSLTADSLNGDEKQRSIADSLEAAGSCSMCAGIPEALSFDRIIAGGTCPPCTVRDFMNYLQYIEFSAENLQFFLWLRSYTTRFAALDESIRKLSPEWTASLKLEDTYSQSEKAFDVSADMAAALKGTGLDVKTTATSADMDDPFYTPPKTPPEHGFVSETGSETTTWSSPHKTAESRQKAAGVYDDAGHEQRFTAQPFRDEISRITAIYIAPDSPRQLNLSSKERSAVLHALEHTTHPSAFRDVATTVEYILRCQSHPNFMRWTICNGNRPRVIFARGLGVFGIVGGLLVDLLLTLSTAHRGWRALAFVLYFIGISTLIAAWKGMCVVLHGMHHRHVRPWELFEDEDSVQVEAKGAGASMDSLDTYHSYETEPWVAKYEKRNVIRKVFDRETYVQEPALRQIQDTIFVQALLGAMLGAAVLTAIFLAVPAGNFL